ncbi:MAG: DUF4230 domain-containing protein [Spirochaetales bacterium]|nr:DUF4230 domain-containing protein [Spirochaetales bacterium]
MGKIRIGLYPFLIILLLFLFLAGGAAFSRDRSETVRLETLENEIQSMAKLITGKQVYREVIYLEKGRFLTDKRVLFSVEYVLKAGIDLEKCRIEKRRREGVILYLPPVEIFHIDCDESTIEEYFLKEQLGRIKLSDYDSLIEEEKVRLREEALASDFRTRAKIQAADILEELLLSFDEPVTLRFSETSFREAFNG